MKCNLLTIALSQKIGHKFFLLVLVPTLVAFPPLLPASTGNISFEPKPNPDQVDRRLFPSQRAATIQKSKCTDYEMKTMK